MMEIETKIREVPAWLADIEFCHISVDEAGLYSYCGHSSTEGQPPDCPGEYNGEALCPGCGKPTCPRCAQLCALEDALED